MIDGGRKVLNWSASQRRLSSQGSGVHTFQTPGQVCSVGVKILKTRTLWRLQRNTPEVHVLKAFPGKLGRPGWCISLPRRGAVYQEYPKTTHSAVNDTASFCPGERPWPVSLGPLGRPHVLGRRPRRCSHFSAPSKGLEGVSHVFWENDMRVYMVAANYAIHNGAYASISRAVWPRIGGSLYEWWCALAVKVWTERGRATCLEET